MLDEFERDTNKFYKKSLNDLKKSGVRIDRNTLTDKDIEALKTLGWDDLIE